MRNKFKCFLQKMQVKTAVYSFYFRQGFAESPKYLIKKLRE